MYFRLLDVYDFFASAVRPELFPTEERNETEEKITSHLHHNGSRQPDKKKQKRETPDLTPTSISLFKEDKDAVTSAFIDSAPTVCTGDPFEEANVIRKAHRIKISGSAPPRPLRSFAELAERAGCHSKLLYNMAVEGFTDPTPIQRQAVTALIANRELLAIAPTGSGKTLAFLIPLVLHIRSLKAAEASAEAGLKAVVVSPTKELSMQSARVLAPLLPGLKVRASVLNKSTAAGTDFAKVDILFANPLRLGALSQENKIDLSNVRYLILDEADKLFDLGFTEQIDAVIAACTSKHIVRALFSATLPEVVENLAKSVLADPLRITVGERGAAVSTVKQRLVFVGQESGRLLALRQILSGGVRPPVLVFVSSKQRAQDLRKEIMFDGVHIDSIHADQSQAARAAAVDNFRLGRTWVLIATDLLGRGMDFAGVNTVVNYDFPKSTSDYIHRIGRTGRAGKTGQAITFFGEDDSGKLRGVAHIMKAAGCDIPEWMLQLRKDTRWRDRRVANS